MLRALLRTGTVFGTIFLAGYVARRYFGWNMKGITDQSGDSMGDRSGLTASVGDIASHDHAGGDRAAI